MGWDDDVYYHPEKHGLTTVGVLDFSSGSYEFDYTAVWVDEDKNLYWADDSGCSCPSPFENYDGKNDLITGSVPSLARHLRERQANQYTNYVSPAEVQDLVAAARKAVTR